jgi:hypothetical protein
VGRRQGAWGGTGRGGRGAAWPGLEPGGAARGGADRGGRGGPRPGGAVLTRAGAERRTGATGIVRSSR